MLKHFSLVILFVTFGLNMRANAQETLSIKDRLAAKFTETELSNMNSDELAFWEYFVTEGFVLFNISKDPSESEMESLEFEGSTDLFNPLTFGLMPEETAVATYRLGNTGQGVMILSKAKIKAKLDRKK